jgi:uncharacterized protein (DUF1778 family)
MTTTTRTQRLEARVTPELKALLVRAAELQGTSLSDFITMHMGQAALCTIRDHERLELDTHEREVFIAALLKPPEPNEHLQSAAAQYRATMGA